MTTLCALPPPQFAAHMPIASFKGEGDMLVDRLIGASKKPEISDAQLKERALVPFQFDVDLPLPSVKATAARRAPSKPVTMPLQQQQGQKRGGAAAAPLGTSPPKKENERVQGKHQRKPASPSSSSGQPGAGAPSSSGRKHRRDPSAKSLPQLAAGAGGRPGKRAETGEAASSAPAATPPPAKGNSGRRAPAAAASTAAPGPVLAFAPLEPSFAGPAFTNSPTPDSLPIPTSSLLMTQAADRLRAALQL